MRPVGRSFHAVCSSRAIVFPNARIVVCQPVLGEPSALWRRAGGAVTAGRCHQATVGGALLVLRLLIAPVALILALTIVVAIGASGIGHGTSFPILTRAPALLLATVFLLARELQCD